MTRSGAACCTELLDIQQQLRQFIAVIGTPDRGAVGIPGLTSRSDDNLNNTAEHIRRTNDMAGPAVTFPRGRPPALVAAVSPAGGGGAPAAALSSPSSSISKPTSRSISPVQAQPPQLSPPPVPVMSSLADFMLGSSGGGGAGSSPALPTATATSTRALQPSGGGAAALSAASMSSTSFLTPDDRRLLNSLLDNLAHAVDSQGILVMENVKRLRKDEAQARATADKTRRKLQRLLDYMEQRLGKDIFADLTWIDAESDADEDCVSPQRRSRRVRKQQVRVLGQALDRVDVDTATGKPTRTTYRTNGQYSSSSTDGSDSQSDDDRRDDEGTSSYSDREDDGGKNKKKKKEQSSKGGDGSHKAPKRRHARSRALGLRPTDAMPRLGKAMFSTRAAENDGSGAHNHGGGGTGDGRANQTIGGNRAQRKNAGDMILDGVASGKIELLPPGTQAPWEGATPIPRMLYTGSTHHSALDQTILEGLSCSLFLLLQSCAYHMQAEKARLYIPHHTNRVMKLVAAVPDAAIVVYRGGQFIAAHQGLPGAVLTSGVAIAIDEVSDEVRRNYLSSTLHGAGAAQTVMHASGTSNNRKDGGAMEENGGMGGGGGGGATNKQQRRGAVESIFEFPIHHAVTHRRCVGVMEFINKAGGQRWSEYDEQMAFATSRLMAYLISTYERALDLHHMPAFQPQHSFYLSVPYRTAGIGKELVHAQLPVVAQHQHAVYIARVSQMEDIPKKAPGGAVVGGDLSPSTQQQQHHRRGTNVSIVADNVTESQTQHRQTIQQPRPQPEDSSNANTAAMAPTQQHRDRIREIGPVRYVKELAAYLQELERTGRSNIENIVATREAQTRQMDDLIKSKSRIKALEDNNGFLRERLQDTQRKLALYMNQLTTAGASATATGGAGGAGGAVVGASPLSAASGGAGVSGLSPSRLGARSGSVSIAGSLSPAASSHPASVVVHGLATPPSAAFALTLAGAGAGGSSVASTAITPVRKHRGGGGGHGASTGTAPLDISRTSSTTTGKHTIIDTTSANAGTAGAGSSSRRSRRTETTDHRPNDVNHTAGATANHTANSSYTLDNATAAAAGTNGDSRPSLATLRDFLREARRAELQMRDAAMASAAGPAQITSAFAALQGLPSSHSHSHSHSHAMTPQPTKHGRRAHTSMQ